MKTEGENEPVLPCLPTRARETHTRARTHMQGADLFIAMTQFPEIARHSLDAVTKDFIIGLARPAVLSIKTVGPALIRDTRLELTLPQTKPITE